MHGITVAVREPLGQQLVPDLGPILVAPELREWLDVRFSYAFSIRVGQLARADGLTRGLQFYRQQSFRFTLRLFREILLEFTSYNTQPVGDPKFLITWGRIHRLRYRSTSPSVAGLTISRSVSKTALCPEDMAAFHIHQRCSRLPQYGCLRSGVNCIRVPNWDSVGSRQAYPRSCAADRRS
jgi:hypothetical protein